MTNEEIEKKIAKLDKLAEDNYRNYQDTGISRYYRAFDKYTEEADLLRRVLNTNDEHNKYIFLRSAVADCIGKYNRSEYMNTADRYEAIRKALAELKTAASIEGIC